MVKKKEVIKGKESDFLDKLKKLKGKVIAVDDGTGIDCYVLHRISENGKCATLVGEYTKTKSLGWIERCFVDSFD